MYVNTIVFKGQWKQQFNKSMTRRGSFYPSPQRQINLPMMTVDGIFRSITLSKYRYYGDNLKVNRGYNFSIYCYRVGFQIYQRGSRYVVLKDLDLSVILIGFISIVQYVYYGCV